MKRSSANSSPLPFMAFIVGVVLLGAAPGFAVMYWILNASIEAAVICGAVTSLFGWMSLSLLLGVFTTIWRKLRKSVVPPTENEKS
jgi:membrane protein implicated in regulation of membrane protease activity